MKLILGEEVSKTKKVKQWQNSRKSNESSEINQNFENKENEIDLKAIKNIHKEIFTEDDTRDKPAFTYLLSGTYGFGKTYKVKKSIEEHTECEYILFDSFQSGFNNNFVYILYQRVIENSSYFTKIIGHSFKNLPLLILVLIPSAIVLLNVIYQIDTKIPILVRGNLYSWIFILFISVFFILTIAYYLPNLLTIKREYTIQNRKYYFELLSKLLPEVLVIDDFDRLNNDQQVQILEFIDGMRTLVEKNQKIRLNKIIILADYKNIKFEADNINTENTIDKYVDKLIYLPSWQEAFVENLVVNNKEINSAEGEAIIKFLQHYNFIITRRVAENFFKNYFNQKSEMSFTEQLELQMYKKNKQEVVNSLAPNSNIINAKKTYTPYCLIQKQVPLNKVLLCVDTYIEPGIDEVEISTTYSEEYQNIAKNIREIYSCENIQSKFFDCISSYDYQHGDINNFDYFSSLSDYIQFKKLVVHKNNDESAKYIKDREIQFQDIIYKYGIINELYGKLKINNFEKFTKFFLLDDIASIYERDEAFISFLYEDFNSELNLLRNEVMKVKEVYLNHLIENNFEKFDNNIFSMQYNAIENSDISEFEKIIQDKSEEILTSEFIECVLQKQYDTQRELAKKIVCIYKELINLEDMNNINNIPLLQIINNWENCNDSYKLTEELKQGKYSDELISELRTLLISKSEIS